MRGAARAAGDGRRGRAAGGTRLGRALRLAMAVVALVACARAAALESELLLPWKGGATPRLALAGLDGGRVDIKAQRGRIVIVNFWATWCAPCREEMPSLAALARAHPGDIVVIAVNVGESLPRVRQFVEAQKLDFPVALDANGEAAKAWRVAAYPSSFVVGRDGRIKRYVAGAIDWSGDDVAARVLGASPPR